MKAKWIYLIAAFLLFCHSRVLAQYSVEIKLELWSWQSNGNEMEADVYSPTLGGMAAVLKNNGQVVDTNGYTCTWYRNWNDPDVWEYYRSGFRGGRHGVSFGAGYDIKAVVTKNSDPSFHAEAQMGVAAPLESERAQFMLHSKYENDQPAIGNTIYFWASPAWHPGKAIAVGSSPTGRYFTLEDEVGLKTSPNLRTDVNKKFEKWEDNLASIYYQNHQAFSDVNSNISPVISRYKPSTDGVSIFINLNGSSSSLVCAEILDPWSQDYSDPAYGNSVRNRGLQAPFVPIFGASNNLGFSTAHQGVFLGQEVSSGIFYSVRALIMQSVQGQSYSAIFQGWNSSGASLSQVGTTTGYDQKAVVFTQTAATVTALYTTSNITTSVTIPAGTYTMAGTLTVASGATLTLSPGTTLKFPDGTKLVINGVLIANGTAGQRINFTKSSSSWTGLEFSGSGANGSSITYATISNATEPVKVTNLSSFTMSYDSVKSANFSGNGALQFYGSNPTISNVVIQGQAGASNGVRFASSSTGSIAYSTIQDLGAGNGIVIQGNSSPRIQSNSIRNNFYHGVVTNGNGSGSPLIIDNSIQNNGSPSAYGQIVVYNSNAPRIGSNALRGGIFTVYCENYAFVTTNWTEEPYDYLTGHNSVYTNLHGLRANNHSGIYFGDYDLTPGSSSYYGACNNIDSSSQLKASAVASSWILAEGNWWGVYPVPQNQIYWDGTSIVWYDYALESQNCPDGEGGGAVAAGGLSPAMDGKSVKIEDGIAAFLRGKYSESKDAYLQILQTSTDEQLRVRAMVGLLEVSRTAKDESVIPLVESYINAEGELGLVTSEVLMGMYAATGRFSDCENVALNIAQKYPNSENEKNALLCLATLKWFDESQNVTSDKYLAELLAKYGSSIDDATLAILGISKAGPEGSVTASATTGGGQLEITSFPNPFNPSSTISFVLPEEGYVTLKVYDLLGRVVAELINGTMKAGSHQTTFDASRLHSGVYFYRLEFGGSSISKKFVLTK